MRLLHLASSGDLSLTEYYTEHIPPYAILSHTWGKDIEEVTYDEFRSGMHTGKTGYRKIQFCGEQAAKDGLEYFWVDSCCINKSDYTELSKAINSMFSWYRDAAKCYVYLSDISTRSNPDDSIPRPLWKLAFRDSRWFTRAWTLQELIAPHSVEFFSQEGKRLGDKRSLETSIHEITGIPVEVFRGKPLTQVSIQERMQWAVKRTAKCKEDEVYSLLGIFGLHMPLIYGEGRANALLRLEEEISKRSVGSNKHGNLHWIVPRPINNLFTGRSELLLRVQQAIHYVRNISSDKQRRFVVTGLGGQGKSEICLQVASQMRAEFWGVFWVDVDKPSTAESDFIAIAKNLGSAVESVPEALQVLARTKQSWLLILDNADDPNFDYQVYLPSGTHGAVLITSRVAECKRYSPDAFEALEGLEAQDSKALLLKAADVSPALWAACDVQAEEVVRLLGSHTLALIQAGAYISQCHCQLDQYPKVYRGQRQRLMQYRPKQAQSRYCDVYATFEASADVLEQSQTEAASDALRLLEILSMLDSSVLPVEVFQEAWEGCQEVIRTNGKKADEIDKLSQSHVSHLPDFLGVKDDSWDPFRLTEATSLLTSLSLVIRHDLDGSLGLSIHPLAHAWAKDRQDAEHQGKLWIAAGCILAFSRSNTQMWRTHERRLLPHIQSYLDIEVHRVFGLASQATITPILLQCGWDLLGMRQDARLGELLRDIFVEVGENSREVSKELLPLYELEARSLYNLGRHRQGTALLEQVVEIKGTTLALAHPSRLNSQHELARAYQANGQVTEAVVLLEQVVEIEGTTLAPAHPDRLASQHALAIAYRANGQVTEAVALLEEVVEIKRIKFQEGYPSRTVSEEAHEYFLE